MICARCTRETKFPYLADGVTRGRRGHQGEVTYEIFNSPWLFQIDLRPAQASRGSLRDIWHFGANRWALTRSEEGAIGTTVDGKQAYTIAAIVRHRASPQDDDLIRLFSLTGMEVIPECWRDVAPRSGFGLDEPLPVDRGFSIFYQRISVDQVVAITPLERKWPQVSIPTEVYQSIQANL